MYESSNKLSISPDNVSIVSSTVLDKLVIVLFKFVDEVDNELNNVPETSFNCVVNE